MKIVDIIGALTQTDRARKYWSDLKTKLQDEGFDVSEKIGQLKLMAEENLNSKVFEKYSHQKIIFLNLKRRKS